MNKLPYEVKKVFVVQYENLEAFILQTYGREWDARDASDIGPYRAEASFVADGSLSEWCRRDMDSWIGYAGPAPTTSTLLNDLVGRKLIEPGEYLIRCVDER